MTLGITMAALQEPTDVTNSIGMTNVADGLEAPGVNENLKL